MDKYISTSSPIVYLNAIRWKIFVSLVTPIFIGLSIWFIIISLNEIGTKDAIYLIIGFVMGLGMLIFSIYALIAIYKSRLEIYSDRICDIGVFKKKQLLFEEIVGYRIISTNYLNTIEIVSKKSSKIKASLIFKNNDKLLKWIDEKFTNVDSQEYNNGIESVRNDSQIGITKEQRLNKLNQAKKIAKAFNIICYSISLWAFIYSQPYKLVMMILVLLPIISIVLIYISNGIIKIDASRNSPYPTIVNGFIISGFALMGRAFIDFNILEWNTVLMPTLTTTSIFYLVILIIDKDSRKKVSTVISIFLFCGVYGFGATIILNSILDSSHPAIYMAEVRDKHISRGKSTSYYLKLSPWGPQKKDEDVRVSKIRYDKYNINDKLLLLLSKGAFNIPWYSIVQDDQEKKKIN